MSDTWGNGNAAQSLTSDLLALALPSYDVRFVGENLRPVERETGPGWVNISAIERNEEYRRRYGRRICGDKCFIDHRSKVAIVPYHAKAAFLEAAQPGGGR